MAAIIGVFSKEFLLLWTGNSSVVDHSAGPLTLLVIAASAGSLSYVAQALQLAEGWTRFAVALNGIGVIVLIPAMSLAAIRYGGEGVSLMSAVWNVMAFCVTATVMHRRLLKGSGLGWFIRDIAPPLVVSIAIALLGHFACAGLKGTSAVAGLALSALVTLLASVSVVPITWQWLRQIRSPAS
jgi:O-antigen/teichoic acid export membrane protein